MKNTATNEMVNTKILSIVYAIGLVHIFSGAAILFVPDAANTTPLAMLVDIAGVRATAIILIAVGFFAVLGARRESPWAIAPQQILLLTHAITAISAIATGVYPDGYNPKGGGWFIFVDQAWLLALCFSHSVEYSFAIYSRHSFGDR